MKDEGVYLMGEATFTETLAACIAGDREAQVKLLRDFKESRMELKRLKKALKAYSGR